METLRVLVINHDEAEGLALGRVIAQMQHRATVATSGTEGLQYLESLPFDAVLFDQTLTDINIASLMTQLGETRPNLPVVVMADDARSYEMLEVMQRGARELVLKPVEDAWLALALQRIGEYLEYVRLRDAQASTPDANELALRFAHAINNPLAAIFGMVQLLLEHPDVTPALREDLELVVENTTRLSDVVNNLTNTA